MANVTQTSNQAQQTGRDLVQHGVLNDRREKTAREKDFAPTARSDRIDAVEFEGQKYRSRTLYTKAVTDSHERARNVRAGQEVRKKATNDSFVHIAFVFEAVLFMGVVGLLGDVEMPMWLAVFVTVTGGIGFFLTVRLMGRLQRAAWLETTS
ncbi:MAG: hypothetical protein ABL864_00950 [Terricaulis sp.]